MQVQTRTVEMLPRGAVAAWSAPAGLPAKPAPRATGLDLLEQFGTPRAVQRGEEIYAAGDAALSCYRVVSGCVRIVGLDADGRRQIADFLLPGDFFGLDSLETHHLSAEALTGTVIVSYPRRMVDALAEQNGAVARGLHEITLRSLRRAHEKMFLLARKTAGERVAAFLVEMAARASTNAKGCTDLPMTRADIADHLGLTIETVSRIMAQLTREGTISASRSGFEICNRHALEGFRTDGIRN